MFEGKDMGRLKIRKTSKRKTLEQRTNELARLQASKIALQNEVRREAERRLDDITSVYYMAYFCLMLHREFGFGQTRLARALKALDELDTELCGSSIEEIRKLALDECGVWLGSKEELEGMQ